MREIVTVIRGHTWLGTVSTSGPVTCMQHNICISDFFFFFFAPPCRFSSAQEKPIETFFLVPYSIRFAIRSAYHTKFPTFLWKKKKASSAYSVPSLQIFLATRICLCTYNSCQASPLPAQLLEHLTSLVSYVKSLSQPQSIDFTAILPERSCAHEGENTRQ